MGQLAESVGRRIKQAATEEGIGEAELADKVDRSVSQIYRYEAGDSLGLDIIEKIAGLCHKPISYFFQDVHIPSNERVLEHSSMWYSDPKRRELVAEVKALVQTADDDIIRALLHVVRISKRAMDKTKI